MSCRLMGSPRLDKAVGTETAGIPGMEKMMGCFKDGNKSSTLEAGVNCRGGEGPQG